MSAIDFPDSPDTNDTFTSDGVTWKYDGEKWDLLGFLPPTYVTALPPSPTDGQEIYYAADAANGVIWHLRYRSGASGSYKWEFLGGPSLSAEVTSNQARSDSTFGDLATSGPAITLPIQGDYDIHIQCHLAITDAIKTEGAYMSYAIGGTAASTADQLAGGNESQGIGRIHSRTRRKTGLGAVTLTAKYRTANARTANFQDRLITATPIRVG